MRLPSQLFSSGLLVAAALNFSAMTAAAQTPPPPTPGGPGDSPANAPPPGPATPPPVAPAAAPVAPAVETPAAVPPAAAPAAAPEETFPAAWTRVDVDFVGLQLWAGATHALSDTIGIATDIYLNAPLQGAAQTLGEFDLGPAFTVGKFVITPMIGFQYDVWHHRANSLVPQLYITGGGGDPIYMELWVQNYENQVFDKTHATNNLYFRYFLDFTLGKYMALGPEVEALIGLNKAGKTPGLYAPDLGSTSNGKPNTLVSLPVGLNVNFTNYGKNNTLMLFAGYETTRTPSHNHLAGRLTFIHNF
jgi:hypothetical protein